MFTGVIETVGTLREVRPERGGLRLAIRASFASDPLRPGESIAVSGPCLTIERVLADGFETFASSETLARTTLGRARVGRAVNLERAVQAGGRLGGHFVSGHVDGVGRVRRVSPHGEARKMVILAPPEVRPLLSYKGSVAVDGVSLTIVEVRGAEFSVVLVPYTLENTTLLDLQPGDEVNVEGDLLARYVLAALRSGGVVGSVLGGEFEPE